MVGVRDHRDLDVWKLCDELRARVTALIALPAFDGHPWLRRQLHDAVESLCPNLAEGFSRFYPSENATFVRITKASLTEVIEHLRRAMELKLVDPAAAEATATLARRARGASTRYVIYLESADLPHRKPSARRRRCPPNRTPEPCVTRRRRAPQ